MWPPDSQIEQKHDFSPQIGWRVESPMGRVRAYPGVLGEDRAPNYFYEVVRSEAFTTCIRIGHAQVDRTLALERHVLPMSEVPEAVRISRRDGIVRAAQRPICADPKIRSSYQHGRIGALRNKRECDQVPNPTMRPNSVSQPGPTST